MTLPKYLRPIHDVETHGLSGTEKLFRFLVFVPLLMLFSIPRGALIAVMPIALGYMLLFLPVGIDTIIHDPKTYSFELSILLAIMALLLFSNIIAKAIRRYFLPFG